MSGALRVAAIGAVAGGAALLLSLLLVPLVRAWARRIGFVDNPGERKFHSEATAYGGGIAIFAALWLTVGGGLLLAWLGERLPWLPPELAPHLPGMVARLDKLGLLFAGSLVLFVTGLIDDMRGLGPGLKLVIQLLVATGVAVGGVRVTLFIDSPALHVVLTVCWIVAISNAINLLDNMDGLAAGVSAIAGVAFCAVALQLGQLFIALFLMALVGALLGFLRYNFNPASVFMGDAGSLVIGFLLAATTVQATYYVPGRAHALVLPLVVMAIPLFDTVSVILLRIRLGKPIYIGDTNHVSHRLVRMGMSPRRAVLVIYLMSVCTGIGANLLPQVEAAGAVLVLAQLIGLLLLVAILERESRLEREQRESGATLPSASEPPTPAPRDP